MMKIYTKKIDKYNSGYCRYFILFATMLWSLSVYGNECLSDEYFVSAFNRTSYYKSDGTFVRASKVDAHCRKYEFNKPLKINFLNKMPEGWPYQVELFRNWIEQEKIDIEKAINELPKYFQNLGEVKLYRAIKSNFRDNPSTSGPDDSIIVFYNSAKEYGYKKVLAHEMAHILWSKLSAEGRDKYFLSASWDKKMEKYKSSRNVFSENDGRLGPEEDFANNIEHILTNKKYQEGIPKPIEECLLKILKGNK